jgi:hypothetical protein
MEVAQGLSQRKVIDRLFRNWKTTLIGSVVMVICFLFVWFGKATLTELGLFVMGGFAMLFLKDPTDVKAAGGKPTQKQ